MTLPDLITTLGPVAGVAMFMWLNRGQGKAEKADPIAQKLDALIESSKAQTEAQKAQTAATLAMEKSMAILLDRSDR